MLLLSYFFLLSLHFLRGSAWKTVTVPHLPGQDNTPALTALLKEYNTSVTILFQNKLYNIFTPAVFNGLTNVEVRIEGNLTFPTSIPAIQGNFNVDIYPMRL
jgi:hypothetical protein